VASPNDMEWGDVLVLGVERSDLGLLPTFFMRVLSSSLLMSSYLGVLCPPDLGVFLDPSLLGVPFDLLAQASAAFCQSVDSVLYDPLECPS
jgi:hypothetical protein